MKKSLGVVLLVIGVILLVLGMQELGAFGSSIFRALGKGPSERALFLLIGGGACTAFGIMQVFRK